MKTLKGVPESREVDLRSALVDFYEANYSANTMTCCLVHNASLEEMEKIVGKMDFHKISRNLQRRVWGEHPFDLRQTVITFAVGDYQKDSNGTRRRWFTCAAAQKTSLDHVFKDFWKNCTTLAKQNRIVCGIRRSKFSAGKSHTFVHVQFGADT
ncbi:hypothetical protein L596_008080 [Steinernema carpocapsae]|uniref:Uncharacterized protein n=1 Tax=Steinernema carpocapsae TaxID=34508 RepID=A0A4U5PBD1_STECR|nr:hypothetical protein L596_008080 [Steinernema carpocapsae]